MKCHTIPTPYPVGPVKAYEFDYKGSHLLFDTGPPTQDGMDYLNANVDLEHLDYLLITHFHPDHYGQIRYIADHSPAEIIVSKYDACIYQRFEERKKFISEFLLGTGAPLSLIDELKQTLGAFKLSIPFVESFRVLEESQELLESLGIQYLSCPGHSQTDIIYLLDRYAVTGDTLLKNVFQTPLLGLDFFHAGRSLSELRTLLSKYQQIKDTRKLSNFTRT